MPIQHINNDMLRIMKRGFGKEKTMELLNFMKALPDSFIRTSFIVGHPHETQEMFDELCEFASTFGFDRMNIFSYSDEENTTAYAMEDKISEEVKTKRAEILGEIATNETIKSLKGEVSKTVDIVIDSTSDEHEYLLSARELLWATEIDGEILITDNVRDEELKFSVPYKAKITELAGDKLIAKVLA